MVHDLLENFNLKPHKKKNFLTVIITKLLCTDIPVAMMQKAAETDFSKELYFRWRTNVAHF